MFWLLYGNSSVSTVCPSRNSRSYENLVGLEGKGVGVVIAWLPKVVCFVITELKIHILGLGN